MGVTENDLAGGALSPRPLRGRPKPLPGDNTPPALVEQDMPEGAPGPLQNSGLALIGLRIAVTRSADRAGGLADALAAAGADPVLLPLIDFEVGDSGSQSTGLDSALATLRSGAFDWLVISSITTVRALKQWCEAAGTSLAALVPSSTRIATIGPTSVAVLAGEGLHAELAPTDKQSAQGLVELWPEATSGEGRVLIPQSDLAGATLAHGIAAKGWDVETVTAYRTVNYPAAENKRLTAVLASSRGPATGQYPLLSPAQAAGEVNAGLINGVVLASGSAARRVNETMAPLPADVLVVAIGEPTAQEARRLGLRVSATAKEPTPAGIVAALIQAQQDF